MEILTIIPARGGSQRVKRKNLLPVAGVPLVRRTVEAVKEANERLHADGIILTVIVSTDDHEIEAVVGCSTVRRRAVNARPSATIADVVFEVVDQYAHPGPVMVLQPTSIINGTQIADMVRHWARTGAKDYVATASAVTGFYSIMDAQEKWTPVLGIDRVNTQYQSLGVWKENGAVRLYPAGEGDYGRPPDDLYHMQTDDIDTWGELVQARARENRSRVVFDIVATNELGAGHLYRCLALADELQGHEVIFTGENVEDWAVDLIVDQRRYEWQTAISPWLGDGAVRVLDKLDTDQHEVAEHLAMGYKVVCLEDRGPGALKADLVINAMYPGSALNERNGPDWAIIRPEFLVNKWTYDPHSAQAMILFGGTDPKDLTYTVADALTASDHVGTIVMTGPGYDGAYSGYKYTGSVSSAMATCDLLITSGGRTVFEAAAIGIPTLVIAQNLREVSHTHVGEQAGNVYLGLADTVSQKQILDAVEGLLLFPEPRMEMSARSKSLVDGKGLRRVVRLIEDLMEGL